MLSIIQKNPPQPIALNYYCILSFRFAILLFIYAADFLSGIYEVKILTI